MCHGGREDHPRVSSGRRSRDSHGRSGLGRRGRDEDALLGSCYRRSLELARDHGLRTLAFPAISTGVYRFPVSRAARIAVTTIRDFLAEHELPERVTLVAFNADSAEALSGALEGAS